MRSKIENMKNGFHLKLFGIGELGQQLYLTMLSLYMLYFYVEVFKLSPAAVGTLMLVARIWDGINDPIIGKIIDKKGDKKNKCTNTLRYFAIPMGVFIALLFFVPDLSPTLKLVWAYVIYIGQGMVYTVVNIAYYSLIPRIGKNSKERVMMGQSSRGLGAFSDIISIIIISNIVANVSQEQALIAFAEIGCVIGCITAGCYFFVSIVCRKYEHSDEIEERTVDNNYKNGNILSLFKNPIWVKIALSTFFYYTAMSITMSVFAYYIIFNLGHAELMDILIPLSYVGIVVASLFVGKIIKKYSKGTTALIGVFISILSFVIRLITKDESMTEYVVALLLWGVGDGIYLCLSIPMISDAITYSKKHFREDSEALIISANSFGSKIGIGIGGAISGWALSFVNYKADQGTYGPEVLSMFFDLSVIFPIVLYSLMAICIALYSKDEKKLLKNHTEE